MPAPAPEFVASTEGWVALTAATAKTVLNVISASGRIVIPTKLVVAFDGTTASNLPVILEVMRSTQATAGTSSAVTLRQRRGSSSLSAPATAAKSYTVEPTVLSLMDAPLPIDPNKGLVIFPDPLGREASVENGAGLALRFTAPAGVNVHCSVAFE